ncbi:hypothetical protein KKF81_05105 [Candidatus Micrarchaeota archaeon]|nr:hypothetical protein [Candidatus Micrarchaeota archaeon]MBU1166305.1 hypothetical protein [Candidatus Micrarchaeota archaeon]MBU1886385.1 hypothetical protein [Candidatus Micrarchaeota archaeon]
MAENVGTQSKNRTDISSYSPPKRMASFFASVQLPASDIIHTHRIKTVLAYVYNPTVAEQIKNAVVKHMPRIGFRHLESPVTLSTIDEDKPVVLFVDDHTINDINFDNLRKSIPLLSIVLLSTNPTLCSQPFQHSSNLLPKLNGIDFVATIGIPDSNPNEIIPAFIRLSEDKLNISTSSAAKRFIVLVVDDEPRWFAKFIPHLYSILGGRAAIMTKRNFDDALSFIDERADDLICVITDMSFPRAGIVDPKAGSLLINHLHLKYRRIAKIVASGGIDDHSLSGKALLLNKNSESAKEELHRFMLDYAALGDFIIPVGNTTVHARSVIELKEAISHADVSVLDNYAENDFFSSWLYMHGFHDAGDRIRVNLSTGETLRGFLINELDITIQSISNDPFVISDSRGTTLLSTFSLKQIAEHIRSMDPSMIEKWESDNHLSYWMMRHGYPELADELRPINGKGKSIRDMTIQLFDKWISRYSETGLYTG